MTRCFCFLLLVLLTACAQPTKSVWTDLPAVETLLHKLSLTTGQVRTLDGAAKVSLTVKEKFFSSQQFLLLEEPDRLRVDVLTGFGQLILQLSSDGEELAVFMHTTVPSRFYRGPATTENLARFTRIPLQTQELVKLLLYDPPLIDSLQQRVSVQDGILQLSLINAKRQQDLLFDDQLQLIGCRYFSAGKLLLEVLYQKIDQVSYFPQTIRLAMVTEEINTTIKFSELQTNVAIPAERFRLQKPDNILLELLP